MDSTNVHTKFFMEQPSKVTAFTVINTGADELLHGRCSPLCVHPVQCHDLFFGHHLHKAAGMSMGFFHDPDCILIEKAGVNAKEDIAGLVTTPLHLARETAVLCGGIGAVSRNDTVTAFTPAILVVLCHRDSKDQAAPSKAAIGLLWLGCPPVHTMQFKQPTAGQQFLHEFLIGRKLREEAGTKKLFVSAELLSPSNINLFFESFHAPLIAGILFVLGGCDCLLAFLLECTDSQLDWFLSGGFLAGVDHVGLSV